MRDQLGTLYDDAAFGALYPHRGQPAETPWRLAVVTVMPFADALTDRQAADAVRRRIDWKYALGLELTEAGFHYLLRNYVSPVHRTCLSTMAGSP
jgi:transposase